MTDPPITSFSGAHRFLSNFYPSRIIFDGVPFLTAEAAFQASKTMDWDVRDKIQAADSPQAAKILGRQVVLRADWEDVKFEMMWQVLINKFSSETLAASLIGTGNRPLAEGNTWHDNIYGICSCAKCRSIDSLNVLGRQLMLLRRELMQERTGQSASRPWLNKRWK